MANDALTLAPGWPLVGSNRPTKIAVEYDPAVAEAGQRG